MSDQKPTVYDSVVANAATTEIALGNAILTALRGAGHTKGRYVINSAQDTCEFQIRSDQINGRPMKLRLIGDILLKISLQEMEDLVNAMLILYQNTSGTSYAITLSPDEVRHA